MHKCWRLRLQKNILFAMKPTKNRMYCVACQRNKMHFESKKKADNFIKFNAAEMISQGLKAPVRSYYCQLCGAWHVTSNPSKTIGERLDQRDKKIAQRIDQETMQSEEFKATMKQLDEKWDDYNFALSLCDLSKAQDVLNEIEAGIPSHTKDKKQIKRVTALRTKVADERMRLNWFTELTALSKDEQHELIDAAKDAGEKNTITNVLQSINSIKLVHEVFDMQDKLIACNDSEMVGEIVEKCRQYIQFATVKSKRAKSMLNKHLDEIMHDRKQRIINDKWGDWLFGPIQASAAQTMP